NDSLTPQILKGWRVSNRPGSPTPESLPATSFPTDVKGLALRGGSSFEPPNKKTWSLRHLCASTQVSRASTLQNPYLMNCMICPSLRSLNDSSTSPFVVTRLFLFTEPSSL